MTTLTHRPGCADPRVKAVMNPTTHRAEVWCATCQAHNGDAPAALTPTTGVPARSRWRCREHPDQAVTWRGTGCPECGRRR